MGEANVINALVSKEPVLTVHEDVNKKHNSISGWILKKLIPVLYKKAKVVVVSDGLKKDLIERYRLDKDKIWVIHNPVNIQKVNILSREQVHESIFESMPVVITMGRLSEEKGYEHLLRAFSKVRWHHSCKLAIIGIGQLETHLKKYVRQLHLDSDIVFLGWQQNPFKFLARAKVFVLSSLSEGFGNVLVEAMACGLPVISTNCFCGPREILAPHSGNKNHIEDVEYAEYGILSPVCDGILRKIDVPLTKEEDVLADAVIQILTDKERAEHYSRVGMQRAGDFDVAKIVSKYVQLLNENRCSI